MKPAVRGALIVAALCAAVALIYWFGVRDRQAAAPPPAPAAAPVPAEPAKPSAETGGPPLPALAESDDAMLQLIVKLLGSGVEQFVLRPHIVHRIVATVDNLPRMKLPLQVMPVKPVGGTFRTAGAGPSLSIGADNADRYARYLDWVSHIDTAQLVSGYRHHYPLFQQAYRDLGYPNGEFNDRLIEAIDDLLEAPQPAGPVLLVVPRAMFEYADPALQDASAGQKIMIRLGSDNEARVKTKLREVRRALDGVELPR